MESHKGSLALLCLLALLPSAPAQGPVVQVEQGQLQGKRDERPYAPFSTIYSFEGVPYARPPLGERRFKDPEKPEPWIAIRNATSFGPNCLQKNLDSGDVHGEEDCLYLNIYTQYPPETWKTEKRPVIVFMHGGGFVMGSGDTRFARPDPMIRQGLIFVTLNYRLGVLGFLNTEDSEAPGNAGLKDQSMALRWVQRNIAAFGGDPANVTIMGESAGAACVHYHMLSPLSKGLFQRAVSVSGSVVPRWATVEQPRQKALALRRFLSAACPELPPDAIAPCLRRVNASVLVFNEGEVPQEPFQNYLYFVKNTFLPSVEAPAAGPAPFLTADPVELLKDGQFARVPYITGFTTGEGLLFLWFGRLLQEPSRWAEVDEHFDRIFQWDLPRGLRTPEAARAVRRFYLGDRSLTDANSSLDTLERYQLMSADIHIAVGTSRSAELMTKNGGSIYVYQFSRDGPFAPIKTAMNVTHIPGVTHGDDMPYIFDFMNLTTNKPLTVPASEVPLRARQQNLFGNFAKTGNPTPQGSGLLEWPLYSLEKERYLDMGAKLSAPDNLLGQRIAFWRRLANNTERGDLTLQIPRRGTA